MYVVALSLLVAKFGCLFPALICSHPFQCLSFQCSLEFVYASKTYRVNDGRVYIKLELIFGPLCDTLPLNLSTSILSSLEGDFVCTPI